MQPYGGKLPTAVFPFIWHFLKSYKTAVLVSAFLSFIAGFWGPFNSILIKHVINLLPQAGAENITILVWPVTLIVLNFLFFDNLTWRGVGYIRYRFAPLVLSHLIAQTTNHLLTQSHHFFQENLTGNLAKQLSNLVEGVERLIAKIACNLLRGLSLILMALLTSYVVHPVFCVILTLWFVCFAWASLKMSQKFLLLGNAQAEAEAMVMGDVVDTLSNQSSVRMFARKVHEQIRMGALLTHQRQAYGRTYGYTLVMYTVQGSLIALMMAFSAYCLVYLYGQRLVTMGDFALIFGLAMETGHMMWFTMSEVDEFNKAVGRCNQSLSILMNPIEIKDKPGAKQLECTKGHIVFRDVQFHYKGDSALFENHSIEIKPGQKVGLVGYSGGGKTTFVQLILRFYEITQGAICIDGQDIRDVTQASLRDHIAMIPQDPMLFHRSLMDNIRYGNLEADDHAVINAAKQAHAHPFITQLPQGYQTVVGDQGVKLSGGQRQRIAIARAILKNAPILMLDEATSQLDAVTETLIQESLWRLMKGKTTLVIAHRLSTLLHMDRILVFDKGKIVEDGSHLDLLSQEGLYKELWNAQVDGFLKDGSEKTTNDDKDV